MSFLHLVKFVGPVNFASYTFSSSDTLDVFQFLKIFQYQVSLNSYILSSPRT